MLLQISLQVLIRLFLKSRSCTWLREPEGDCKLEQRNLCTLFIQNMTKKIIKVPKSIGRIMSGPRETLVIVPKD